MYVVTRGHCFGIRSTEYEIRIPPAPSRSSMTTPENHALLLTAPGPAAIAVVRAAGPGVPAFLAACFSRRPSPDRPVHGELRDGDRVIDDPVVALAADGSFADLSLHGGPWVVRATLELLARHGFSATARPPVPLPHAAVDAADEIEREVLAHLPRARTELGVRSLLAQPAAWRRLVGSPPTSAEAGAMLADVAMRRLLDPPRVAVVGAANVGKSTLANRLFGQDRSVTADLPGTTRDWVGELADLGGVAVTLVDTPGLRATNDPIEQAAIARARPQVQSADAVVVVVDAARPLDAEQSAVLRDHPTALVAVNKVDRLPAWDAATSLAGRDVVRVVATTGEGVPELQSAILRRLGCDRVEVDRPRWWTERQRGLLEAWARRK
jgi:tRNA modification GTPase